MSTGNIGTIRQFHIFRQTERSLTKFWRQFYILYIHVTERHEHVLQHSQVVTGQSDSLTTLCKKVNLLMTFSPSGSMSRVVLLKPNSRYGYFSKLGCSRGANQRAICLG